jgi:LacI family transcriptional regulator
MASSICTVWAIAASPTSRASWKGYRDALKAHSLAYRDEYVAYGDYYVDSGREATQRLLALDEPPTAIVAASDLEVLGALRACADAGVSVPHDLSIVGFDDIQLAAHLPVPLTTVRQDKAGLGAAAGEALTRCIAGEGAPAVTTLPVELVVRESTAPPRAGA